MSGELPKPEPVGVARPHEGAAPAAPGARGTAQTVSISSEQLFTGATEVQIRHGGALYRLKQTSLGKLILTK